MRINTLIQRLEKIKKQYGSIEICLDLKNIMDNSDHDEYFYEPYITVNVHPLETMNMSTGKLSKPKPTVIVGVEF